MQYLIADFHLDHANIIDYCDRPYGSVEEMNRDLITNWNTTVDADDVAVFLGDLSISTNPATLMDHVAALTGDLVWVRGNHDTVLPPTLPPTALQDHYQFTHGEHRFYCVHDPADAPRNYKGWVIHGHHHNNHLDAFPFLNPDARRVNVSVELIDYTPLPVPELVEYIDRGERLVHRP